MVTLSPKIKAHVKKYVVRIVLRGLHREDAEAGGRVGRAARVGGAPGQVRPAELVERPGQAPAQKVPRRRRTGQGPALVLCGDQKIIGISLKGRHTLAYTYHYWQGN